MRVRVKLYASLRQYAPESSSGGSFEVDLPEGATLKDLIEALAIPEEEPRVNFVNGLTQPLDYELKPGDEVGLFPPIAGGSTREIVVETWLYGELARFGGEAKQAGYANLAVRLPEGSTLGDLLNHLRIPANARGITFINGNLSAMPGLQPDLDHRLEDGDRVAFFHLRAMWPFQYRAGIPMANEMSEAMKARDDHGLRHDYERGG